MERAFAYDNPCFSKDVQEEEDVEEEALSLCDLPINEEEITESRREAPGDQSIETQEEDFDFCSSWGGSSMKESQMCAADEVFFQGQILPNFRLSVSSETSKMDHYHHQHSGGFTSGSSRSSSIRSHQSSSSSTGSSSTTTTTTTTTSKHYKPRARNLFHSHPSPTPQIRSSNVRPRNNAPNPNRKSTTTMWTAFRVGLVTTPEIALQDLKIRSNCSRNSTSSSNGTLSYNGDQLHGKKKKKKNKQTFDRKLGSLFGGCRCSVIDQTTVPSRVVVIKRNSSSSTDHSGTEEKEETAGGQQTTKQHQRTGKQTMSRRRTFEWLKQLSLEGAATEEEAS